MQTAHVHFLQWPNPWFKGGVGSILLEFLDRLASGLAPCQVDDDATAWVAGIINLFKLRGCWMFAQEHANCTCALFTVDVGMCAAI